MHVSPTQMKEEEAGPTAIRHGEISL